MGGGERTSQRDKIIDLLKEIMDDVMYGNSAGGKSICIDRPRTVKKINKVIQMMERWNEQT